MKKILVLASLLLIFVLAFVACTGNEVPGETEAPTSAPTEEPTVAPTEEPTTPVENPTETPTEEPTEEPTQKDPDGDPTEEPTEAPTEPPVDPADPVWIMDADDLAAMTTSNKATVEKTEDGFASFTATDGDPWFLVCGNIGEMPEYMAIRYRTNTSQSGEFFISEGAGPEGGKSFIFNYENNGEWNLLIFHLPTVAPYMTSNTVGHIRYDFYTGGADDGFLEVAYIAFFNSDEYAQDYDFKMYPPYIEVEDPDAGKIGHSFDTFYVNGGMYFPEDGGAGDKLTAQDNTIIFGQDEAHDSMVLRGWIGFGQPIASFGYYVDNYKFVYGEFATLTEDGVKAAGGEHASRFEITVPLSALEGGFHKVGFIVKLEDGTVVHLREDLKVIIVPKTTDDFINLGTGHGAPFSGAPNNYFGQRFDIGETILKKVSIADMATYSDGNTNTWTFKVWQWNTDYATTVAGTPLFTVEGENHPDNSTFNMDIPADKFITGDIYYEISYESGSGCFTGWTSDTVTEGVETYVAGQLVEGTYSASLVVGTPVTEEEEPEVIPEHQLQNPPVYIVKARDMMMTNANQMKFEKNKGFVHFVPQGGDPNFMLFYNQTGSRYAVIKYRTEYTANIQIFLGSTGAGPSDDTVMMEQALNPDGEWHLAIFDTNVLLERGVYDGTTAAYLRLDVMEAGYILDADGNPQKNEDGSWMKEPLPEGATIDIAYFAFFDNEETINGFEYGGSDEPEYYENYNVPMDSWTVSGHAAGLTSKDKEGHGPMVAAGGLDVGALLHQGAIGLGEIDLSKYSKVVIYYGIDNSQTTIDRHAANANNRIMLVSADTNMTNSPADETIIAGANYELGGWAIQAFEIDLTNVDYNGPVFVTYDTLPGTFMLIGSIEFIGGEIDYSQPEEPEAPAYEHDYVADGLVSLYNPDGQDPANKVWKDLIGKNHINVTIDANNYFTENGLMVNSTKQHFPGGIVDTINGNAYTVEFSMADLNLIGRDFATIMNSTNDRFALFYRVANGVLEFKFAGCAGPQRNVIQNALPMLQDALVTITYEVGGNSTIYINGEVVSTMPAQGPLEAPDLFFGHSDETKQFSALFRSIRFYNRALTAEEVAANAAVDRGTDEPVDPEAPEYYEDVVVDLSQFADQPTYMPSFPEAGINVPLFNLGYTNYIAIGEMDLSKYSKVEITYSFDGSDVTLNNYNNASSHAIGLKSTPTSYGQVTDDNFDGDIAHADMEFAGGWTSYKTAVVDLSEVTYNGPVYVTMHNPQGTTIAISGVKFIGAEKTAEPETPAVENVVIDISTIEGHRPTNNYGYDCPILNIGYDNVFLAGEFDLNQYSQIIIEYSYDGDTVLEGKPVEQNWTECGRTPIIGFTALNKCFGFANITNQDAIDNGIYTDLVYTPGNWAAATRTATIEIPENIGYNGPCYISAYNPWNREIAVVSITLVPRA